MAPSGRRRKRKEAERKRKRAGGQAGNENGSENNLYAELQAHALSEPAKQLLHRSASLGQRSTAKEQVHDAFLRQRFGLCTNTSLTVSRCIDSRPGSAGDPASPGAQDLSRGDEKEHAESHGKKGEQHSDFSARAPPRPVFLPANTRQAGWESANTEKSHNVAEQIRESAASIDPTVLSEHVMSLDPSNNAHAKLLQLHKRLTGKNDENKETSTKHKPHLNIPERPVLKQFVVRVNRREDIQRVREELPIIGMEQEIVETITYNDISIVCGATGCGKTTQVPQFLYEAGYGHPDAPEQRGTVAVTQPRRVAVTSTACRVADELNLTLGDEVGYQVRYDKQLSQDTSLKFMTDGILLREVQEDLLLRKYGVIIVDEAHERSVNTDILLGILSRVVPMRRRMADEGATHPDDGEEVKPLKLIVMSATLRVQDFRDNQRLCPTPPPLIEVPTRQFPVTIHFAKRTELHDYVNAAYKKVSAIHRKLPKGDVLVFLTGQREVEHLCKKLQHNFGHMKANGNHSQQGVEKEQQQYSNKEKDESHAMDAFDIDDADAFGDQQEDDLSESDSDVSEDDIEEDEETEFVQHRLRDTPTSEETAQCPSCASKMHDCRCFSGAAEEDGTPTWSGDTPKQHGHSSRPSHLRALPLYATLSSDRQSRVFEAHGADERTVIVATNVAETSITIPGVRYVVDCGRAKHRVYERGSGLSRFEVDWISKASAEQRSGRAGRTGPGHCYRLYSSAHFNDNFEEHTQPAILNVPIEGTVLQMKAMGIEKVVNFPFPTPPSRESLKEAEATLVTLGAIDSDKRLLTPLGKAMSGFPVSPRHSRMLLEALSAKGTNANCLRAAVSLTAVLSLQSPFLSSDYSENSSKRPLNKALETFRCNTSDAIMALNALREYEEQLQQRGARSALVCCMQGAEDFCEAYNLHSKTLREMMDLRQQLANILECDRARLPNGASRALQAAEDGGVDVSFSGSIPHVDWTADAVLRRAICAGWSDRVAKRVSTTHLLSQTTGKALRYTPCNDASPVYLHPSSSLHTTAPPLVAYTEVLQAAKRPYMLSATSVEAEWLSDVGPSLCTIGQALSDPPPRYDPDADDVIAVHPVTYGEHSWELPRIERPVQTIEEAAPIFAAALLEGRVMEALAEIRGSLVAPAKTAMKATTQGQRRVSELVHALQEAGIRSRADLCRKWTKDPEYLKRELRLWYRDASELDSTWPLLQQRKAATERQPRKRSNSSSGKEQCATKAQRR